MKTFDPSRFFYQDLDKGILRTPDFLVQEMISKIPEYIFESSTTTFLDPACGGGTFLEAIAKKLKGYDHSWENITSRIFGIDIDPFSGIKQAQFFFGPKNIIVQDFLEMSFPDNWPKRFDVIVSNPPYSKKLDLKFLDKAFDIANQEVVFVHPATAFVERKKSVNIFKEIRDKVKENLNSLTLFNGNGVFGIGLYVPCSITHITKINNKGVFLFENKIDGKKQELKIEQIDDLSIFGLSQNFLDLEKKINPKVTLQTKCFEDRKNKVLRNPNNFFVAVPPIVGHTKQGDSEKVKMSSGLHTEDFFICVRKSTTVKRGINPTASLWWEFQTELEAINFLNYCKTDFARFCISLTKMDQNIQGGGMKKVPWMDFTQEWTDEKLYAHFNITKEEQEFIKEVIPPYYD